MSNCIDIISPFVESVESAQNKDRLPRIQIIGGIGSAALSEAKTEIKFDEKLVIAPKSFCLDSERGNGSKRDVDIFVLSSKKEDIDIINDTANLTIGDGLEISVFGIKSGDILDKQLARPFGHAAIKSFLSDRYETNNGLVKSVFPLLVPIDVESLETWKLIVNDTEFNIPNPAMSLINYSNRSISGLRSKDADKIIRMSDLIKQKEPKLIEWAVDGPGASQTDLGLLLRSFTPRKKHYDIFGLDRPIIDLHQVAENEAFMLHDVPHSEKIAILGMAAIKATALNLFETNNKIVEIWQRFGGEEMAKSIIGNK